MVYLNPGVGAESLAVATTGTHQVGYTDAGENADVPALAATRGGGTAASYRNLNPAGAVSSVALGAFGDYQVGWAELGSSGTTVAALWNGTADSWEDLSTAHDWIVVLFAGTKHLERRQYTLHRRLWLQ